MEPAEKPPKNRQNRANLLIMVSFRFQRSIQVERPAKTQEIEFGVIRSRGERRTASSWSRPKKKAKSCSREQNWGNLLILVNFRFQHPILVKWPAKAQETEFGAIRSRGKRKGSVVLEPAEKPTKNRQNRANLLIMVSFRFQRSIQLEWPAKTQETEFGVIRSRGKRRTVSSWSRPKKRQKLLQGAKLG